jgi:hypothetical protein
MNNRDKNTLESDLHHLAAVLNHIDTNNKHQTIEILHIQEEIASLLHDINYPQASSAVINGYKYKIMAHINKIMDEDPRKINEYK